jgi:16S rRNA (cytosine967-C5)-methyltransferase
MVSPARAAAWRALLRLDAGKTRFDDSVSGFPELDGLDDRDRALAHELVTGTVKRRLSLDAVLGAFTRAPLRSTQPDVLTSLRLAAFQVLFLDRVPAHAAVDDAVTLVADTGRHARGFVNAVLRRVATEGKHTFAQLSAGEDNGAWSIRHSCPRWMVALVREELGDEAAGRFFAAANARPERCLRVNTLKADVPGAAQTLAEAGYEVSPVPGSPTALLYEGPALERSAPFAEGVVTPQSRGSQLAGTIAAEGIESEHGARVLDLCAAPGTKTSQLAAAWPGVSITAIDLDAERLAAMQANLARLGVERVEIVTADARALPAEYESAFDAALLDAPCSGLGTLSSRPDVRWRRRPEDIRRLAELQRELILSAARCVRPGGTLTYSLCSLPRRETLDVVDALLQSDGGWSQDDLASVRPEVAHPRGAGALLVLPPDHGSTGFFIARLRRAKAEG